MSEPWIQRLKGKIPFLVVASVFAWSTYEICAFRRAEEPPGTITLRLGHWQLESSFRDAINEMAADYAKIHPNVRIVQDAVPESVYPQWSSTQMMGGTAPDIIEMYKGPYQLGLQMYNRYCIPLTSYVDRPNPYNKGTALNGIPLRKTYIDGLQGGYIQELQEYMQIPVTCVAIRVFYNKDLYRKLTGRTAPPRDFRDFAAALREIKSKVDPQGRPYIPIANSKFHSSIWESGLCDLATYRLMEKADFSRDGWVGNDELYVAVNAGRIDFHAKPIEVKFKLMRLICDNSQVGFTGLSRDEAVFLFAQQRAVFISTGTWDARSLMLQAEGDFEVGVMDFPIPSKDDPEFGELFPGPRQESAGVCGAFAITRTCKHPDIAIDFLLFLSSQANNEKFNKRIGWIPCISGAGMDGMLAEFKPCYQGIHPNFSPFLGGETYIRWNQLMSLFQIGQISYDEFVDQYSAFYKEYGLLDFQEQQKDWRRGTIANDAFLAGIRSQALFPKSQAEGDSYWIKYRSISGERLTFSEIWHARQARMVSAGIPKGKSGPYEYAAKAIERINSRLRTANAKEVEAR